MNADLDLALAGRRDFKLLDLQDLGVPAPLKGCSTRASRSARASSTCDAARPFGMV